MVKNKLVWSEQLPIMKKKPKKAFTFMKVVIHQVHNQKVRN